MRILVIAPRFPWPLEKGDKLRLYQQIRHLSRTNEIHLFAISHTPVLPEHHNELATYCASITTYTIPWWRIPINFVVGLLSGLPFSISYFTDPIAKRLYKRTCFNLAPDIVLGQLIRVGEYLKLSSRPRVIDMMDAFSHIAAQRKSVSPFWMKPALWMESILLKNYEQHIARHTDMQLFISERDRTLLDPHKEWPAITVPNGIDTEFFTPRLDVKPKYEIVFVGNMGYFPNIEAARFLVEKIMPLVWSDKPEVKVLLAGARPHPTVRRLAESRVTISGWLPDIRMAYASGLIFVGPLFHGAGLQNKILEAMAMHIPVITTSHVHTAFPASEGMHVCIAETAREFADNILSLLDDPAKRESMTNQAYAFLNENYSWHSRVQYLEKTCFHVFRQPNPSHESHH